MIRSAESRLPTSRYEVGEVAACPAPCSFEVVFANALFLRVPDHTSLLSLLDGKLASGQRLAVRIRDDLENPVHQLTRETSASGRGVPSSTMLDLPGRGPLRQLVLWTVVVQVRSGAAAKPIAAAPPMDAFGSCGRWAPSWTRSGRSSTPSVEWWCSQCDSRGAAASRSLAHSTRWRGRRSSPASRTTSEVSARRTASGRCRRRSRGRPASECFGWRSFGGTASPPSPQTLGTARTRRVATRVDRLEDRFGANPPRPARTNAPAVERNFMYGMKLRKCLCETSLAFGGIFH